jgi:Na+/H+-dicarboxylate symporter
MKGGVQVVKQGWQRWQAMPLWQRILAGLVTGALVGWLIGPPVAAIGWLGDLFLRLIRMLIVPLVFSTLASGIVTMDAPGRMLALALRALALYLATTLAAVTIGIGLAVLLRPGTRVSAPAADANAPAAAGPTLSERLIGIVPENMVAAFADGDVLAVIFVAALVGAGVVVAGQAGQALGRIIVSLATVTLTITGFVMELAPIGVFALAAVTMGTQGISAFLGVAGLALVVGLGGFLHMALVQIGLVRLVGGIGALEFLKAVRAPQLMAFSTSSSAATLPASLAAAQDGLGVTPAVASAVLPLGATVNMDGTALYVAAVAVFAAQMFGVPLAAADYALIALTTVLVSIGTASVPSASLFLMAAVLEAIGISAAQVGVVIALVLPVDRLLDMWRTLVNVTGDLAVARAVDRWEEAARQRSP